MRYTISRSHTDEQRCYVWKATNGAVTIGSLIVDGTTLEIQWIGTVARHRRRGVATALLAAARADGIQPVHSPWRTPDGELWARSTGDPLPRNAVLG